MLQLSWLRRPAARRLRFQAAPRLEYLEDRCLLATLVGLTATNSLVRFDSSTPGTIVNIAAVTGVNTGQALVDIGFQPQTGALFGLGFGGGVGQLYQVNPTTAKASAVGSPFSTKLVGTSFGFSIDPVSNTVRIVSNAGENLRVDPNTGALVSPDANINPGSDTIAAIANNSNLPGAAQTTLYGYDFTTNQLVTIGSVNGTPNSPNTGTISNVGPTGVVAQQAPDLGFSIDANGTAYLGLVVGGRDSLYTANLKTGAVTIVGGFTAGVTVSSLSVAPAVSFSITGYPTPRTAGLASPITVSAETIYNTVATGYSGTAAFTSSDPAAALPANTTLSNGSSTFSVTLNTPGPQSITATDTTLGTITGSQMNINVLPNTEIVGITPQGQLVRFFSATPNNTTTIGTVTGLNGAQKLVGIAFRPATGGLYGLGFAGGTGQLYSINPTTAAATAVGTPFSTTISGQNFGFTFDPVKDFARVTTDANENFEVNATTGALIMKDTSLTPAAANVVGIAYDNNFAGAATTTLYGYDVSTNNLVTIGSVGGSPSSANTGLVKPVGPSGVVTPAADAGDVGFAIDASDAAYLDVVVNGNSGLYTVNLTTGAATLNGVFGSGIAMKQIAVAPAVGFAFGNLGSTHIAGANSPVTVNAVNVYGDVAASYQGTIKFSSTDAAAALPPNSPLKNGSAKVNVTFNTVGPQSLTATDTVTSTITGTAGNIPIVPAVDLVGLSTTGQLLRLNSATPNSTTVIGTVTGLASGQTLVGVDFRPGTDQLYGLAFAAGAVQLYRVNPLTAVANAVGSPVPVSASDTSFGFGFDPVADNARVTSNTGENLRLNPNTGAILGNDGSLTPLSLYAGAAYSNNFLGATQTTLYSYDLVKNNLVTIGSVNGLPNSPNTGLVSVVGPSGVTADSSKPLDAGFDIGGDGVGYLNLLVSGASGLYTANLSTGSVSLIGNFTGVTLESLTMAPATSLSVTGYPSPVAKGTSNAFTVKALDPYGLPVPSYKGTVTFSSSDPLATLPVNSTLINGVGTFNATFNTLGTQSLTVVDTSIPTINGTQNGIIVNTNGGGGGTSPPPPPTSNASKIGVVAVAPAVRAGMVVLDSDNNGAYDSGDAVFNFGVSSDTFVTGDWANLGLDSLGIAHATTGGVLQWVLDSNANNAYDSTDTVYFYGANGATPVTGDWTASGSTKIGVVQKTTSGALQWVLNTSGTGIYSTSDAVDFYGANGDIPIVGAWTGGASQIGVVRPTASGVLQWVLNTTGTGSYNTGDTVYYFGANGDIPVAGDWTGTGKTFIGVVRPQADGTALWVLDTGGTGTYTTTDPAFIYGLASDRFIVGNWQPPLALYSGDGVRHAPVPALKADATFVSTIDQSIAAWQQAGLSPELVLRLENVNYSVGTLGSGLLGATNGNNIVIDATALGHGWSASATPQSGQMDLFTALAHEMGHILGLPDQSAQPSDLLFDSLLPGIRKTPSTQDVDAVFAALGK